MSFPDILKTRHPASIIGIQNMPEEAYGSGSAEGQCTAAPLSPTRWTRAAGERCKDEDIMLAPAGECLAWRDPEFVPWLLGYEVLRDADAH